MKNSPFKIILANTLVFFLTLSVGFAGAEILLRVKNADQKNYNIEMWRYARLLKARSPDPDLGHEHRPNTSARLQGVQIRINSLGMRGAEPELEKHPGEKRILVLGSSNTLGWGVREDETMAAYLQKGLEGRAVVLNAGIGNYNAFRYVKLLDQKLIALKPDIVVVHFFLRDAERLQAEGGNAALRHSELAVELFHLFHQMLTGQKPQNLVEHYQQVYAENAPGLAQMKASLDKLEELSRSHHFKVILAMVPDIHAIQPYPFQFIHDKMRVLAAEHGWDYVDFYPALSRFAPSELWAMPGDPHINRRGQKAMADALLPYLQ